MQYNFVIIRTDKGSKYARKILNSIKWINEHKYPQHEFFTQDLTIGQFMSRVSLISGEMILLDSGHSASGYWNLDKENTIIHARCANPRTEWTIKLRELEEMGYKVVNSVDTIELTSNKLACSLHLQGKVNHPKSWEYRKDWHKEVKDDFLEKLYHVIEGQEYFIAKPLTSLEQGANVQKIGVDHIGGDGWLYSELINEIEKVPGNKIVIQEFIPYTALHRVIVINNKALPYTFIDKPEWHPNDWKVSCCLNRTTMKLNESVNPKLLELAERTQKEVGGVINFIDIFEYNEDVFGRIENIEYTNAEINTACSLNIHERLAKLAGRNDWNIHFRVGKELVHQLLGE